MKRQTHTIKRRKLGRPLTRKERESLKFYRSLSKKKQHYIYSSMKKLFIKFGIISKDGKLISRNNLKAFQQMLAEQRKQRALAQKPSKKLELAK